MPMNNAMANSIPPAGAYFLRSGYRRAAEVAAVVFTVSVAVAADDSVMLTLAGMLQVGGSLGLAMLVVITQARLTAAAKPPEGVTVMVDVFPDPAPGLIVRLPLFVSVKLGLAGAVTETFTTVFAVIVPVAASVPVIVIAYAPGVVVAVVPTVSVPLTDEEPVTSRLDGTVQVAGLVAAIGAVVIAQARLMTPTKLFVGVAVIVAVLAVVAPPTIEREPLLESVNFEGLTSITTVPLEPV